VSAQKKFMQRIQFMEWDPSFLEKSIRKLNKRQHEARICFLLVLGAENLHIGQQIVLQQRF
jgi:hypothetical protein